MFWRASETTLSSQVGLSAHWGTWGLRLISGVFGGLQRDLHLHDLDIVLLIIARVSSNQQSLLAGIRPRSPIPTNNRDKDLHKARWEPFCGECGPGERVRVERVVEEGRILLPDLVLLKDHLLLYLICVFNYSDLS